MFRARVRDSGLYDPSRRGLRPDRTDCLGLSQDFGGQISAGTVVCTSFGRLVQWAMGPHIPIGAYGGELVTDFRAKPLKFLGFAI